MHKFLFLDHGVFNGFLMSNAKLHAHPVIKDKENGVLFTEEFFKTPAKPWEVRYDNGYPNVIYDPEEKIYRCYYTLFLRDDHSANTSLEERKSSTYHPASGRVTGCCYAESKDGIHWVKPNLGLVEYLGTKENNILFRRAHGTGVFYDKLEKDPAKRYKLITKVDYSHDRHFMVTAFSADGIHFSEFHEWPEHNPQADTHNFAFRDERTGKFILITRIWKNSLRIVAKCESEDFINWSAPVEIARGWGFENEIYSMPVFQYEKLYLGLASIYHEGDRGAENFDRVDVQLMASTTLDAWEKIGDEYFIPRGEGKYGDGEFDNGCVYASIPVEEDGKLWFYYLGGNGQHTNFRETSLGRGYVPKDKLAYYATKRSGEEALLTTRMVNFYGDTFKILADLEEGGHVTVALKTQRGETIPGFDHGDMRLTENNGWYDISYENHSLWEQESKTLILEVRFQGAKLYAFEGELDLIRARY